MADNFLYAFIGGTDISEHVPMIVKNFSKKVYYATGNYEIVAPIG